MGRPLQHSHNASDVVFGDNDAFVERWVRVADHSHGVADTDLQDNGMGDGKVDGPSNGAGLTALAGHVDQGHEVEPGFDRERFCGC